MHHKSRNPAPLCSPPLSKPSAIETSLPQQNPGFVCHTFADLVPGRDTTALTLSFTGRAGTPASFSATKLAASLAREPHPGPTAFGSLRPPALRRPGWGVQE